MTEQEAMGIIMQVAYDGEFPLNSNEAFGIACKCIEKQIPKEPSEVNDEALKLDGIFDWCCGKCGTHHRNDFLLNYCSDCGQAIKWE